MKITKTITETKEKVVGFRCDLCKEEYPESGWPCGKGSLHSLSFHRPQCYDGCDGTYSKWVDLCFTCTGKVFKFITDNGGEICDDYDMSKTS